MSNSFLISGKKENCINCENCLKVCKLDAIRSADGDGSLFFPQIDESKCVNCGMCQKVCPMMDDESQLAEQEYAVGWTEDMDVLLQTSSGGMFQVFARQIIAENGWVFGTEFSREKLAHVCGYADERVERFSGSKYVKSFIGTSFKDLKEKLDMGAPVLFGGTPCQCEALRKYLNKPYENLFIVDIICHGSPVPEVFESYLVYLEKEYKSQVVDIKFRNKDKGWKNGQIEVTFANGQVLKEAFHADVNKYANVFYSNIALSPGCKDCKYNTMNRVGDITLGDFWGYKQYADVKINEMGTSVLLINSAQGKKMIEKCKDAVVLTEVTKDVAMANNPPLYEHTAINPLTNMFCKNVRKYGFAYAYTLCLKIMKIVMLPVRVAKKVVKKYLSDRRKLGGSKSS